MHLHDRAKREWRIATSRPGRSASPTKVSAYSADALRRIVGGKIEAGVIIFKNSLRSLRKYMRIKKGDNVIVIAGKDKGSEGKVLRVFPHKSLVLVEGVNMQKKHQKARRGGAKGQITEFAAPIHVSNVAIKDPKTGKPSRIGYKTEGGEKVRISKKSGTII